MKIKRHIKFIGKYAVSETYSNTFVFDIDLSNHEFIRSSEFKTLEEVEKYLVDKEALRIKIDLARETGNTGLEECLLNQLKGVK